MVQLACIYYACPNYLNTILCTFSVPVFFSGIGKYLLFTAEKLDFVYYSTYNTGSVKNCFSCLTSAEEILLLRMELERCYLCKTVMCNKMRVLVNVFKVLLSLISVTSFIRRL